MLVTARWRSRYTDSGRCERLVRATRWACGSDLPRRSCTDGRCCTTSGALAPTTGASHPVLWAGTWGRCHRRGSNNGRVVPAAARVKTQPNGSGCLTSRYLVRVPGKKKGTLTETPLGHHLSLCPLSSLRLRVRSWSRPRPQTDTDRLRKHLRAGCDATTWPSVSPTDNPSTTSTSGLVHDTAPAKAGTPLLLFSSVTSGHPPPVTTAITRRSLARTRQWKPWAKGARTLPSSLGWAEKQLAMTSCSAWATAPPN